MLLEAGNWAYDILTENFTQIYPLLSVCLPT